MKILIIGNGFDIAHALNTRYSDFQSFVDRFETEFERKDSIPVDSLIRAAIGNPSTKEIARSELLCMDIMLNNIPEVGKFFHQCVSNNLWLDYFRTKTVDSEFRWMDYEKEIEHLIIQIDNSIGTGEINRQVEDGLPQAIAKHVEKMMDRAPKSAVITKGRYKYSFVELLSQLKYDLIRITNALEIYMEYYVQDCNWKNDSSHRDRSSYKPFLHFSDADKLLSFNYTDTFLRQYNKNVDSCYVHGKVCVKLKELYPIEPEKRLIERIPSIVLGISDENEDGELKFNVSESVYYDFQKFILRERYGNKHWTDWIRDNVEKYDIHIVGHSLAYSDKDILEKFLLLPESRPDSVVNIYYYDENARDKLQKNLLKLIGKANFKKLCGTGIKFVPVSNIYSEV